MYLTQFAITLNRLRKKYQIDKNVEELAVSFKQILHCLYKNDFTEEQLATLQDLIHNSKLLMQEVFPISSGKYSYKQPNNDSSMSVSLLKKLIIPVDFFPSSVKLVGLPLYTSSQGYDPLFQVARAAKQLGNNKDIERNQLQQVREINWLVMRSDCCRFPFKLLLSFSTT